MEASHLKPSVPSRRRLGLAVAMAILFLSGCRSNCDLVEAELRTKDNDLRQTHEELDRQNAYNAALQRELAALRGGAPLLMPPAEQASQIYTLKAITLGRQTGGLNEDAVPGDELLQVVLEPRDADNQAIKAPGTLTVQAYEITPEGLKRPLCSWRVPPDALRRAWKSGLWSSGYFVSLPWKVYPNQDKVRVVAQFLLADGRAFEADKDVTVKLVPLAHRKAAPPDLTAPDLVSPEFEPLLPRSTVQPPFQPTLNGVKGTEVHSPRDWGDTPPSALIRAVQLLEPVPLK